MARTAVVPTSGEESAPELVDFSVTYGECGGYCTTALLVLGAELELVLRSNNKIDPDLRFRGTADEHLTEQIRGAAAVTVPTNLARVYGKPDSHDEGAATLRLAQGTIVTAHSYSATAPPPELEDLHNMMSAIVNAWVECEAADGVTFAQCP